MEKITNKAEYFWENVDKTGSCWVYTGSRGQYGYGRIQTRLADGKRLNVFAHRFAFELTKGEIPEGYEVCHRCDNPSCVNPEHLFLGTHQDNMDDMAKKDRVSFGEKHWNRKLTDKEAQNIKLLWKSGITTKALTESFGISRQSITDITHGRTWVRSTK